jgi:hypothetical protein
VRELGLRSAPYDTGSLAERDEARAELRVLVGIEGLRALAGSKRRADLDGSLKIVLSFPTA